MTWARWWGSIAWAVSLVLTACALPPHYSPAASDEELMMAEVILSEADRGGLIKVDSGSRVLLRLPENPSTGYRWELEAFKDDALQLQSDHYQAPETPAPGAGGVRIFDFHARSPGTVSLRLRLRRPWEPESEAAQTFEATVHILPSPGSDP